MAGKVAQASLPVSFHVLKNRGRNAGRLGHHFETNSEISPKILIFVSSGPDGLPFLRLGGGAGGSACGPRASECRTFT